jgi:hypothetical protein
MITVYANMELTVLNAQNNVFNNLLPHDIPITLINI